MSVSERLKVYLKTVPSEKMKNKSMSEKEFETKASIGGATVSNIGENPTTKTLKKIQSAARDLNIDWLLTGQGEMLLSNEKKNYFGLEAKETMLKEADDIKYMAQNSDSNDTDKEHSIHKLVDSNHALAVANRTLSMTNYELAIMLKKSAGDGSGTQHSREPTFLQAYHSLLKAGVAEGRWKSEDEGQSTLDNVISGISMKPKE